MRDVAKAERIDVATHLHRRCANVRITTGNSIMFLALVRRDGGVTVDFVFDRFPEGLRMAETMLRHLFHQLFVELRLSFLKSRNSISFQRRERFYQVEIVPIHEKRNDEGENQ